MRIYKGFTRYSESTDGKEMLSRPFDDEIQNCDCCISLKFLFLHYIRHKTFFNNSNFGFNKCALNYRALSAAPRHNIQASLMSCSRFAR